MRAEALDLIDRVASAPLVVRGIANSLRHRLKNPKETPGRRMPISTEGVPGAERMPSYYLTPFHAQHNGYLSPHAARGYDLGVNFFFIGADVVMRRKLLDRVRYTPRRILELGCGTGTSTLLLAKRWPGAHIDAVDLSPFFLERAEVKARRRGLTAPGRGRVRFHQENAEKLPFAAGAFDLVTSTFMHHEMPVAATRNVLAEAFRLLEPGKQLAICDAAQECDTRFGSQWFPRLLWEPYYAAYTRMDWEAELRKAGFAGVRIAPAVWAKTVLATKPA